MATGSKGYIAEFDGMRGVSILLVMLYHFWKYSGTDVVGTSVSVVSSIGWAGVDVFFVLSGFLITRILVDSRDDPHYWRNFYVRRSLRIFPLYYGVMLALLVGAIVANAAGIVIRDPSFAASDRLWINFLYLTNFARAIYGIDYVPLDIAWSLAIEEQFYLVFPLIVWYASRTSLKRWLVAAIVLAPVLRLVTFQLTGGNPDGAYVLPFCRMDALAVGGLAALLLQDAGERTKQYIITATPYLALVAVFLLLNFTREDALFVVAGYSMTAIATAAFVMRTFLKPSPLSKKIFQNRGLVYVGKVSYGLYLLHLFARAGIDPLLRSVFGGQVQTDLGLSLLRLMLLFAGALVLATVSFYTFEKPILALKDRYAPSSAPRRPPEPAYRNVTAASAP